MKKKKEISWIWKIRREISMVITFFKRYEPAK